jgi:hypothetical protein
MGEREFIIGPSPFTIRYKVVEDYKNEMVKIGWEK